MKHLIIGAGATLAEAQNLGVNPNMQPPLISNFARKTWQNYTPHPVLELFLTQELNCTEAGNDPRETFFQLENEGITNIEAFFEFCWINRNKVFNIDLKKAPSGYISGLRLKGTANPNSVKVSKGTVNAASGDCKTTNPNGTAVSEEYGGFWKDFLYHGIGSPICFMMSQCFHENGKGWRDLQVSKAFIEYLKPSDLVLNLNYDTIFEIALEQVNRPFAYVPNTVASNIEIAVCKPHGSLNLVSNDHSFVWGQPTWLGMPEPNGYESYSGIIPPRLNKTYEQHPIANIMISKIENRTPNHLIFWGVGLTESDQDLLTLYRKWAKSVMSIDVINPSQEVSSKIEMLLEKKVNHYQSYLDWLSFQKGKSQFDVS